MSGELTKREQECLEHLRSAERLQAGLDVMRISTMAEGATVSEAIDFASGWDQFTPEGKRQLVELITDRIVIGKEEVEVNLRYLPTAVKSGGKATRPQASVDTYN